MLKLEEQFSNELYLIGQELYDLLEYNRTLFGFILNKMFHRPYYIRELKKDLFKLVSKIEKHVYYRLRNTIKENEELSINDMENLLRETNCLLKRVEKEAKMFGFFTFMVKPYLHWLSILKAKIETYLRLKNNEYNLNSDFRVYIDMIDRIDIEHNNTRKHVLPYWFRLFDWLLPDNLYKELSLNLDRIKEFQLPSTLPSIYHLLLKKKLVEKAIQSYADAYEDEYPVLFSNFQMNFATVNEIERKLDDPNNHLQLLSERLDHYLSENDLVKILKSPQEITILVSQAFERNQAAHRSKIFTMNLNSSLDKKSRNSSRNKKAKIDFSSLIGGGFSR